MARQFFSKFCKTIVDSVGSQNLSACRPPSRVSTMLAVVVVAPIARLLVSPVESSRLVSSCRRATFVAATSLASRQTTWRHDCRRRRRHRRHQSESQASRRSSERAGNLTDMNVNRVPRAKTSACRFLGSSERRTRDQKKWIADKNDLTCRRSSNPDNPTTITTTTTITNLGQSTSRRSCRRVASSRADRASRQQDLMMRQKTWKMTTTTSLDLDRRLSGLDPAHHQQANDLETRDSFSLCSTCDSTIMQI